MSALGVIAPSAAKQAHCPLDDWDFDPRYTDGVCPICGWAPEGGAVAPKPAWMQRLERLPWDMIMLGVLFVGLLAMGIVVARAAHVGPFA